MKSDIVRHGYTWYTDKEIAKCPECTAVDVKFDSAGEEERPTKKRIEVGEGEEKHIEYVDEMVKTEFVVLACGLCGCKFKVFK